MAQTTNGDQVAVIGYPYDLDPTREGQLFQDPDGDRLTYVVTLEGDASGLEVSGTSSVGTPTAAGECYVRVEAEDGRGGEASESFILVLKENAVPQIARPNANVEVALNAPINYDASQADATFSDPDGHGLTYRVTVLEAPSGFRVQGTRVTGEFHAPGIQPTPMP